MNCLRCNKELSGRQLKFCCRGCKERFHQNEKYIHKRPKYKPLKSCIKCEKELIGNQRKFCCRHHQVSWNHKYKYRYKWSVMHRSKSPRNYLAQLRSYFNRKETLSLDFLENLYFSQNGKCAISGVEMTYIHGQGRIPTNISIDRLDNDQGYYEDNVQLICHRVNHMRNEGTVEELKDWCKKIINASPRQFPDELACRNKTS